MTTDREVLPITHSAVAAPADTSTVSAFLRAIAARDFAAVGDLLHSDATWNHRNNDRFAGVHRGTEAITAFMGEAMHLTNGTLQPVPQSILSDGQGHVAVVVRLTGARPDGRSSDDLQVLLFELDANRVRAVEHFVGDPAAVTAFWA